MIIYQQIEKIKKSKQIDYIEAILLFSEENNIEIDLLGEIIKKDTTLVSKIQFEAENLRILKKGARLPI